MVGLLGLGMMGVAAKVMMSPGAAMTKEANAFLATLNEKEKKATLLGFEDKSRVGWHFIPKDKRKGLMIKHMSKKQKRAAFGLLRAALSQVGYDKARTIMSLESILAALEGKGRRFSRDPQKYYVTIFGKPSKSGKWGLSFEGHHLSLNFVVDKNQVVSHSPAFFGGNPNIVDRDVNVGPVVGTYVLEKEERLAFELLGLLTGDQKKTAITAKKAPRDVRAAGSVHPPKTAPIGLPAKDMTSDQRHKLWALIHSYVDAMPSTIADKRMAEIAKAGIEKIHFSWAGPEKTGVGHYYRVQGPTFLIEFCNTQPDAAGNPASHPHALWRDMRGDFGLKL